MQKAAKLTALVFFIFSFLILCRVFWVYSYLDFNVYYSWTKWINYPPVAIVFFSFLSLLPQVVAAKIWTFFSMLALLAAVFLIFRLYDKKIFSTLGFLVLGLVCFSFPVKFTLGLGQINNFVLLVFVAAIFLLNKNKKYLSMFLLALSFAVKLFPSYLLLYFVLAKKWKLLVLFTISLIALSLFALLFLGWQVNATFYQNFLPTLVNGWKTDYYNQSLTGFIGRSFARNGFSLAVIDSVSIIFILTSCLTVFKSLKDKMLTNMGFGLLITLNLIVNNFSWQHHFVFLLFPFLVTLFYIQNLKNNLKLLFILFISYVLVSFNLKDPHIVPVLLQSHVLYGAVLLWILEVYLIWKDSGRLRLNFSTILRH